MKSILYIDLDNTLVDFQSGIDRIPETIAKEYWNEEKKEIEYDNIPTICPTKKRRNAGLMPLLT